MGLCHGSIEELLNQSNDIYLPLLNPLIPLFFYTPLYARPLRSGGGKFQILFYRIYFLQKYITLPKLGQSVAQEEC